MRADVVIVTWRAAELTLRCLEHLMPECRERGDHVVVVDNASGDGTVELLAEAFPDVELLELPENVGFGRAVNAGAARGSAEAIVLVNNDLFVEPGFVAAITIPLADERVGAVAGLTLQPVDSSSPTQPVLVDGFGIELDRTLTAYNRLRHRPAGATDATGVSDVGILAGPSGGAAAYRRTAFEQAGGFDDRLFAYAEDLDLALRLRIAGWEAAATRDARGTHLGGATTGVDSPVQRELAGFGRGFILRRYGVLRSRAVVRSLAFELLIVVYGVVRFRTLLPLRGRIAGWRAARGPRLSAPSETVDRSISAREQLHRARTQR